MEERQSKVSPDLDRLTAGMLEQLPGKKEREEFLASTILSFSGRSCGVLTLARRKTGKACYRGRRH